MTRLYDDYAYHVWASMRVLEHLEKLPAGTLTQEVQLGFSSLAEVLGHLAAAEEIWLARLKGEPSPSLTPRPFQTVEQARLTFDGIFMAMRQYLDMNPDSETVLTYRNLAGKEFQCTIADIVQHVLYHGAYHRGNISTILRSLGHRGVGTDYFLFKTQ
ncbi:damage-inducible protein DinB [Paenibacillus albicereus]|uniref:Damage-inducible protein DinB n=1 Tax=Paenibacillus albicereus TaxID=2726185 RepID=A0A6H2GTZ7_9BACL|nr:DinB family protein [Paenibacillus albicereus]QJC50903.1 damage-inducible protein DinB [Paenibacillus albicereus]